MCFVIRNGVVVFLPLLTEAEDLCLFPAAAATKKPGTIRSSKRLKMTTLRRGNDALGTRHLSHPPARNSVVLSILLKVVLMNGIARRKRCTVATSSRRQMVVSVSQQTTEHINTVHRKPASQELFPSSSLSLVEEVGLQLHCAEHLAWLGRGDLLQVPWCKRFHGVVVVINLWSDFGCALYALLPAGNRVIALTTEHTDDGTEALL